MDADDEFLRDLANMPETIKSGHVQHSIEEISTEDSSIVPIENEPLEETSDEDEEHDDASESDVDNDMLPSDIKMKADELDAEKTQKYVLDACKKLVEQGYDTLTNLQDTVVSTADGKTINGYATLMGNIGKILDTVNSVAVNKQRMNHHVRMETLKSELKRKAAASAPKHQKNTINIVAGREEIMKMLESV